jgi:hypothetical protein
LILIIFRKESLEIIFGNKPQAVVYKKIKKRSIGFSELDEDNNNENEEYDEEIDRNEFDLELVKMQQSEVIEIEDNMNEVVTNYLGKMCWIWPYNREGFVENISCREEEYRFDLSNQAQPIPNYFNEEQVRRITNSQLARI